MRKAYGTFDAILDFDGAICRSGLEATFSVEGDLPCFPRREHATERGFGF
jgi:hypothetical protein